jgi:NAD(P)-dependent dehydrogenase (short-subunit alcohol dehydrogenase family)
MRTIAITGSASGIGLATRQTLEAEGARVIGIDLQDCEVKADLATREGRAGALQDTLANCDGRLDGFVACAGISGIGKPGSLTVAINYFGAVELLEGLQPALAKGNEAAAVAISSNSVTTMPNIPDALVESLLAGDEDAAASVADQHGGHAYAGSKLALARWVRRQAVGEKWIQSGITLNAVAPGRTSTPFDDAMLKNEQIRPHLEAYPIPRGRLGQPEEIGGFIAYLLGPNARFFCGSLLYIDGGSDALMRADEWPATMTV